MVFKTIAFLILLTQQSIASNTQEVEFIEMYCPNQELQYYRLDLIFKGENYYSYRMTNERYSLEFDKEYFARQRNQNCFINNERVQCQQQQSPLIRTRYYNVKNKFKSATVDGVLEKIGFNFEECFIENQYKREIHIQTQQPQQPQQKL